ncbi:MAG: hypothetical protein ACOC97_04920 [Myxococcota bacterium]
MAGPAIVRSVARWSILIGWLACLGACDDTLPPESSFYDERISPVLVNSCARQTTGCHVDDGQGRAAGNLDVSSFDSLMRRRDVLPPYGPYSLGLLLLKGGDQAELTVDTHGTDPGTGEGFARFTTDIRHNAGQGIALDSNGFSEIKRWIESGFMRSGVPRSELSESLGACRSGPGSFPGFSPGSPPADEQGFEAFVRDVQPVLRDSCAGGFCHGNPAADLYLSCGDTEAEQRWNFFAAVEHLTLPASTSDLLRRPLALPRGGTYHEGGDVFASIEDGDYQRILEWAEALLERRPELVDDTTMDEGLRFFADRVQPAMVRKGCMFLNCHSPAMFHDLRLRGGSGGHFSTIATHRNYEMSLLQLAVESPDPNQSRLIAKNLFRPSAQTPGAQGIAHRGGALLEEFGPGDGVNPATPDDCADFDADAGDLDEVPAYCILARWHEIERQAAIDRGEVLPDPAERVVWVARPTDVGDVRDFDTFRGGADLRSAPVTLDADGAASLGASSSLLGGCGLGGSPDVRNPAVSWDGQTIAFAARASAAEPLRLYWMAPDGSGCEPIPGIAPAQDEENGILTHDFDPAFAPDGRIVFASTRGNLRRDLFPYEGPTRTPAAMQPNANLYIFDPSTEGLRQLTFLLNQELAPSFMADGRVIFTAEKREPEFHMLALRRQNLDGGDYHPLFAQRQSVGFRSATEVVELPNRNLAFVAAPLSARHGAGTIVVVNRSIGPDQDDREPGDKGYIHSMSLPAPGAFGAIQAVPTRSDLDEGVFRSPAPLPSGRLLVSCDLDATALDAGPFDYDLCELDPASGEVRVLAGEAGVAEVEAVAVYGRPVREVFESRSDEVNGNTHVLEDEHDAVVHVLDMPMLGTLLFANTRGRRPIDSRVGGFDVLEARPPPASAESFADVADQVVEDDFGQVFVDYREHAWVPQYADGSAKFRIPGGRPILLRLTDSGGRPLQFEDHPLFTGEMRQREQMQFYPGERANQSMPRRFFNGLCGGCHGSVSGRELDIAVDVDALTSASRTQARDEPAIPAF